MRDWRWPWKRAVEPLPEITVDPHGAKEARARSTEALMTAINGEGAVRDLTGSLERLRKENHFATQLTMAMRKRHS